MKIKEIILETLKSILPSGVVFFYNRWRYQRYLRGYFLNRKDAIKSISKRGIFSIRNKTNPYKQLKPVISDVLNQNSALLLHFMIHLPENSTIVDYGGGYGNTYKNIHTATEGFKKHFNYVIIERDEYVPLFKAREKDKIIYMNLNEYCSSEIKPEILFCCGSLQYVEDIFENLSKLLSKKPKFLIIADEPLTDRKTYYSVQGFANGESVFTFLSIKDLDSFLDRSGYSLEVAYRTGGIRLWELYKGKVPMSERIKYLSSRIYRLIR